MPELVQWLFPDFLTPHRLVMRIMPTPRIIHEDVQLAVLFSDVIDECFYSYNIGMITRDGLSLASSFADRVNCVINRRGR